MVEFEASTVEVFHEVLSAVDGWMDRFWDALGEEDAGLERARELTVLLWGRVRSLRAASRLRPWRALYGHLQEVLDGLAGVWESSLEVYEAPSMRDAQRLGRALQEWIDIAAAALDRCRTGIDRLSSVVGMSPEDQVVLGAANGLQLGGENELFSRALVREFVADDRLVPGVVELVCVSSEMAGALGERDAFADIVRGAVRLLGADRASCCGMVESEVFTRNFSRAIGEIYRSGIMVHLLAVTSGNERLAVDAAMQAVHGYVESGTRHPVAVLAASVEGTGYRSALEAGAAQCIRVLRRAGHGLLVDDLDLDLRNAEAHRAYRITDDHGIEILNDRGNVKRRLSSPQLVDAVAAGAVVCSALAAATVVFACAEGLDIMPLIQTAETFPVTQAMQVAAIVLGWPCPRVEVSSDENEIHLFETPVIEIGFDGHQAMVATTAFTLTSQAPGRVRRVVFHDVPGAPLVVDVEHARGITCGGPFERSLAMLTLLHSSRRNDRPAVSRTQWHRAIISAARKAIDDEDGVGTIRRLLALRKLVRVYGDAEADSALTDLVNAHRAQLTGQIESITVGLRLGLPGFRDNLRDSGDSA